MRSSAASALGEIGTERAVGVLIEALKDTNSYVRRSAAEALGQISDKGIVNGLTEALASPSDFAPRVSAQLIFYYSSDWHVVNKLAVLAKKDPSREVRIAATEALTRLENKRRCLGLSDT